VVETEQNILRRLPPPFARLQSYVLGHADAVLARSAGAADVARRKGFTGPVRVVGNAVDPDLFRPSDRAEARRRLGLGGGFLVGYVGRLAAGKGLLDLVDALARCPDDVGLVLAGSGPDEDEVRRRAHAAGLAGRVTFLPRRPREELTTVMNALDALALVSRSTPTWKEQFGRVIVEAHACAVPVIGSDSGAIPEVVGEGGLIVPEGDPAAVAAAIGRLRDDPGLAGRLGAAGRRRVEERWTWERVAAQTRDLYLDVLGHGERPPDEDALA
jgi:glycosyltransferase involved in cell wall biosynthesis